MQQPMVSNLARKFDFLQERAQRRPIRESSLDASADGSKKTDISHLKEFYLQRLAKTEPSAAARLGAKGNGPDALAATQASSQVARPTFKPAEPKDVEDLEVMCNNCFTLIRASEAPTHNCLDTPDAAGEKPNGPVALIDLKLKKLRVALEARLRDSSSKVNVMRHLTQLRYHIDTAAKWTTGCSEIGALSDHTVQQVKQLTATSRVLAPAVYIFSKRIENVVVQKERELRRSLLQTSSTKASTSGYGGGVGDYMPESRLDEDSVADVHSIVSELDSDCGTQYAETLVTQDGQSTDVGNVQDANDYLNLKNEDEQRRWFYAQTLTVKLSLSDKTKARKTLISDLYAKVREEGVAIEGWVAWIRTQLMPEEDSGGAAVQQSPSGLARSSPSAPAGGSFSLPSSSPFAGGLGGTSGLSDGRPGFGAVGAAFTGAAGMLDRTVPVPGVSAGAANSNSMLSGSFPSRSYASAGAPAFNPGQRPGTAAQPTMYVRRT